MLGSIRQYSAGHPSRARHFAKKTGDVANTCCENMRLLLEVFC